MISLVSETRFDNAKDAYSVRNVPKSAIKAIESRPVAPTAGDVVLMRVVEVGRLEKLERPGGRKSDL